MFPYNYKGGDLFGLHYGSFFDDSEALLARMKAEEEFFANSLRQLPLWIDFYETSLTGAVLTEFCRSMDRLGSRITKMAIVGCSNRDKRRLAQVQKKLGITWLMPVKYFNDPELAKIWLVSE